ncbi:hypothetical protein WQ57_05745 [Mesobacillus campisalis]|uniref:FHA domain-containing protein n=2 Tax=Mesobacillus campisalis TaxID=1408103 RepID=A0A0M2SWS8_9BACI|nr:hypothetical protein WQ57_05745 [Mesobacillus campisalis]
MIKQVSLTLDNQFLFYKKSAHEVVDTAKLDWLQRSSIPGILPCVAIQDKFIRYDLAGATALAHTPVIIGSSLYSLLANIAETLMEAKKAGLDTGCFVMNKNQVFIDPFSNALVFIYLPVKNNSFEKVSLKEFIQELITVAPYDENSGASFFIKLHNYLLSSDSIEPEELAAKLGEWALDPGLQFEQNHHRFTSEPKYYSPGSALAAVIQFSEGRSDASQTGEDVQSSKRPSAATQPRERPSAITQSTERPSGSAQSTRDPAASMQSSENTARQESPLSGSFKAEEDLPQYPEDEGTTVLGVQQEEEEGTTVLGTAMSAPYLLAANGEKIYLDKPVFKIGRDPLQADYTRDNLVIGRVHALFLTQNGEYFFEDNASRNGSFINGVKAEPQQKIKIRHEDCIKLANEEYIFRLF